MPNIRISDWNGYAQEITSTNPVTLALWLLEQSKRISTLNSAIGQCRIIVFPLVDFQGRTDWPPGQIEFTATPDAMAELAAMLQLTLFPKSTDLPAPDTDIHKRMREIQEHLQR